MIRALGYDVTMTTKRLGEGSPDMLDVINDGTVDAVVNTVNEVASTLRDGFEIRRAAVEHRIPCFTSLDTARAAIESLLHDDAGYRILSSNDYFKVRPTD